MSITDSIIIIKNSQYKEYIDEHRANVQKAWNIMKSNKKCVDYIIAEANNDYSIMRRISDNIDKHDLSKYDVKEFDPYRKNFFPINDEEKKNNIQAFEIAWEHHYTKNLHHWDWWAKTGNECLMKTEFLVEMICDWQAMSFKFGGTALEWYNKNKDKIILGENQRTFTENLLELYCE